MFWSTAWIIVFLAIVNSIAANSNAPANPATRVFYALSRNGLAPQPLGRTHPTVKPPHVANLAVAPRLVLSLLLG